MGCDFCVEFAWALSGDAGGVEASSGAAGEGDQHGVAGRYHAVANTCALLLIEGGGAYVDEGHGEGAGPGDCGKCGGAGDDRSRGEGCAGVHAEDGADDSDGAEWNGGGDCGGGALLCGGASFYYRADSGCGWGVQPLVS